MYLKSRRVWTIRWTKIDQYGPVAGGYTPVTEVMPLGRYGKLIKPGVPDIEYG